MSCNESQISSSKATGCKQTFGKHFGGLCWILLVGGYFPPPKEWTNASAVDGTDARATVRAVDTVSHVKIFIVLAVGGFDATEIGAGGGT